MDIREAVIKTIADTLVKRPMPAMEKPEDASVDEIRTFRRKLRAFNHDHMRSLTLFDQLPCALQLIPDEDVYKILDAHGFIAIVNPLENDVLGLHCTETKGEDLRITRELAEHLVQIIPEVDSVTTIDHIKDFVSRTKHSKRFFDSRTAKVFRVCFPPPILVCLDGFVFLEQIRETLRNDKIVDRYVLHFSDILTGELLTYKHVFRCKQDALACLRMFHGRRPPRDFFHIIAYHS